MSEEERQRQWEQVTNHRRWMTECRCVLSTRRRAAEMTTSPDASCQCSLQQQADHRYQTPPHCSAAHWWVSSSTRHGATPVLPLLSHFLMSPVCGHYVTSSHFPCDNRLNINMWRTCNNQPPSTRDVHSRQPCRSGSNYYWGHIRCWHKQHKWEMITTTTTTTTHFTDIIHVNLR